MHDKLPELKLATFCGEISEWLMFWSLFDILVHSRDNLDDAVKFTYLMNCLVDKAKVIAQRVCYHVSKLCSYH